MSSVQAQRYTTIRASLSFHGPDDVVQVKWDREHWLSQLFEAIDSDWERPPANLSNQKRDEWMKMQKVNRRKMKKYLDENVPALGRDADTWTEACIVKVFDAVGEAHENGGPRKVDSVYPNVSLKCSDRMIAVVGGIQRKTIVRFDVIQGLRIYQFVAHPRHAELRKRSNNHSNTWK